MIIIKVHYDAPISEIDKHLMNHREFLDRYYQSNLFIMSGPMVPRIAGIIIAATQDLEGLKKIMAEDPFAKAGIASYEYLPFTPVKYCAALKKFIEQPGDSLC